MTLTNRNGIVLTAFAALLLGGIACGGGSKTKDGGGDGSVSDGKQDGTGDTTSSDTGPGDTGPGDTGPADTGKADTGPGDTGPGDATGDGTGGDGSACTGTVICAATGDKRCDPSGGGVQTCTVSAASPCGVWSTPTACGANQTCTGTGAASACTCKAAPTECAGITDFPSSACGSDGSLVTCNQDADMCVTSTSVSCGDGKTCTGAAGAAMCTCGGPGIELCDSSLLGSYCIDTDTRGLCVFTGGCYVKMDATDCTGAMTCQGPTGAAYCDCPAEPGDPDFDEDTTGQAGTGCTDVQAASADPKTSGACDSASGHITKCTAVDSGTKTCNVYQDTTTCTDGLACTTDMGDVAPYCGCPDVTDGVFSADPVNGHNGTFTKGGKSVHPTGANVTGCQWKTLGACTDAANAWVGHSSTITNSSGADVAPIEVGTWPIDMHGLTTGMTALVEGVVGNTNANGLHKVTRVNDWNVTLDNTIGNGSLVSITGISVTSPIQVDFSGDHHLNTGDSITIVNSNCNEGANGTFTVTKVDADSVKLDGSVTKGSSGACGANTKPRIRPAGTRDAASCVAVGSTPVQFNNETDTIAVEDRVSVTNAEGGTNPDNYVINHNNDDINRIVVLTGLGAFEGLTVNNTQGSGSAAWTALTCADPGSGVRAFSNVVLNARENDGATRIYNGIMITNGCVATANDVVIGGPDVVADPDAQESGFYNHGIAIHYGALTSDGGLVVRNSGWRNVLLTDSDSCAARSTVSPLFEATGAVISNATGDKGGDHGYGAGIYAKRMFPSSDYPFTACTKAGPVVRLHGGSVDHSAGDGIEGVVSQIALDDGVAITDNTGNGVSNQAGQGWKGPFGGHQNVHQMLPLPFFTSDSSVDVANNGAGLYLSYTTANITGTHIHNNGDGSDCYMGYGVFIENGRQQSAQELPMLVTLNGVEVNDNYTDGVYIARAPRTSPDLAKLVNIDGAHIHHNGRVEGSCNFDDNDFGGRGVATANESDMFFTSSFGLMEASVIISNSQVDNNGLSGIEFQDYASLAVTVPAVPNKGGSPEIEVGAVAKAFADARVFETVQDSEVNDNNSLHDLDHAGIFFRETSELTGFTGNELHHNWGPELKVLTQHAPFEPTVDEPFKGAWDFTPLTDSCDDTANVIRCYAITGSGEGDVGISIPSGVSVDARWIHWHNASPAGAREYSSTATVTWMPACSAQMVCP